MNVRAGWYHHRKNVARPILGLIILILSTRWTFTLLRRKCHNESCESLPDFLTPRGIRRANPALLPACAGRLGKESASADPCVTGRIHPRANARGILRHSSKTHIPSFVEVTHFAPCGFSQSPLYCQKRGSFLVCFSQLGVGARNTRGKRTK